MPTPYFLKNIQGINHSSGSNKTAHQLHHLNYHQDDGKIIPVIYKENKNGHPEASIKEVAFSELARLIMRPHSTPEYHLVFDSEQQVFSGVASHHIQLSIDQKENLTASSFKKITFSTEKNNYYIEDVPINQVIDIPFQFLNQLPHGFFSWLMNENHKQTLSIDMDSLANTLINKYALEEGDLNKGNVGVYTLLRDNKPHVVFFNIDHEFMLSDSITSFLTTRFFNLANSETDFNITAHDLRNFPDLKDSANYYWPTRKRLFVKIFDNKVYSMSKEREAFKNLKYHKEFNRYKWKRFLKCALLPNDLIQNALALHLDVTNPGQTAELHLIAQALNERMIKLKSVLLSMPEFRSYLSSPESTMDLDVIQQEINEYINNSLNGRKDLLASFNSQVHYHVSLFKKQLQITSGDNPLHLNIRLGQYRFQESQKAFGSYLNCPNKQGKLPIDIAAELALTYKPGSERDNPGNDPLCIIKHLLSQGAQLTATVSTVLKAKNVNISEYRFQSRYYQYRINNYPELKTIITQIGQDTHLCLKSKKMIAFNVIKQHINKLTPQEIKQLNKDLNGDAQCAKSPEFLFISQLRSSLWIIRIIRGLYGYSSTRMALNRLIKPYLAATSPQFFSASAAKKTVQHHHTDLSRDDKGMAY